MRLIKFTTDADSTPRAGVIEGEQVLPLAAGPQALSAILHADDLLHKIEASLAAARERIDLAAIQVSAPIDNQEVWARGSPMAQQAGTPGRIGTGRIVLQPGLSSSPPRALLQGHSQPGGGTETADPGSRR